MTGPRTGPTRLSRTAVAAAAAVVLLALSACDTAEVSAQPDPAAPPASSTPAAPSPSSVASSHPAARPTSQPAPPPPPTTSTSPTGTARPATRPGSTPATAPPAVNVTGKTAAFVTPSGRFECAMAPTDPGPGTFVRCDFFNRVTFTPPPKPKACPLDWGATITLTSDRPAAFTCAGDTVDGSAALNQDGASWHRPGIDPTLTVRGQREAVLAYGTTMTSGNLACTPEPDGLTCRNTHTHTGFFLSRDRYRLTLPG